MKNREGGRAAAEKERTRRWLAWAPGCTRARRSSLRSCSRRAPEAPTSRRPARRRRTGFRYLDSCETPRAAARAKPRAPAGVARDHASCASWAVRRAPRRRAPGHRCALLPARRGAAWWSRATRRRDRRSRSIRPRPTKTRPAEAACARPAPPPSRHARTDAATRRVATIARGSQRATAGTTMQRVPGNGGRWEEAGSYYGAACAGGCRWLASSRRIRPGSAREPLPPRASRGTR